MKKERNIKLQNQGKNVTKHRNVKLQCSEQLELLLKIVNLAPVKIYFPSVSSINLEFQMTFPGISGEDFDYQTDIYFKWVTYADRVISAQTPMYPELKEYIFADENFIERYENFLKYRAYVDRLVDRIAHFFDSGKQSGTMGLYVDTVYGSQLCSLINLTTTNPTISPDGKLVFTEDLIVQALRGVDAIRLRSCKICGRIFWANRLDKYGCSLKCNQTLRTRKRRTKEKNRFSKTKNSRKLKTERR